MRKKTKINIAPYAHEMKIYDGGLEMIFSDNKTIVNIKVPRWWIGYLAQKFHGVINDEQEAISRLRAQMRGE